MLRPLVTIAALWLLQLVAAAVDNPLIDLVPMPREVWDDEHAVAKRAEDYGSSVGLQTKEQLMWTSSEKTTEKQTVVSVVVYSKQDETIIDMDKFAFTLESVSCSDKMVLKFRFQLAYLAAKISWNWVNFNNIRSFVLITSWKGCGEKRNRDPWVVSSAAFDDKKQTITLNAVKSTWKKVSNTMIMDFGDFVPGKIGARDEDNELDKRLFDISLNKAFTLDLTTTFPEKIAHWNFSKPHVKANLGINCVQCGTSGTLVFAGHIEAGLFGLEKFEISAKPNGVRADLNLEVAFEGQVDFAGVDAYKEEFTLLTLPLPSGWRVPGVLTFGPNIQINAGFQVDYIGGTASLTTGIAAVIPDSSIAKVDLTAEKPLEISGWLPDIQTKPLEIQAQIDAEVHVYTEVAVAVTLEVFEENGVNVDIGLRVPDITIEASAGYSNVDGVGFCPNNLDPWGLKLDASLGASLYLEGYTEIGGDKKVFLNVPLFESPVLYEFPQLCLSFEKRSPGSCVEEPNPEDSEYQDPTLPPEERLKRRTDLVPRQPYSVSRRSDLVAPSLVRRRPSSSRDPYYMACDNKKESPQPQPYRTQKIKVQHYPVPYTVVKNTANTVATMIPLIKCTDKSCPVDTWKTIQDQTNHGVVDRKTWATEHVYEGNWVVKYLNRIQETYFKDNCTSALKLFGDAITPQIETPETTISDSGAYHEKAVSYTEAMMQNIGTEFTVNKVMALLPNIQNSFKNLMFDEKEIDGQFTRAERTNGVENTAEVLACQLGRIVTVCEYMSHPTIQERLKKTIKAIETVLVKMDARVTDRPNELASFRDEHEKWFKDFYEKGFVNARKRLKDYAIFLSTNARLKDAYGKLDDTKQKAIEDMAKGEGGWCTSNFVYPQ